MPNCRTDICTYDYKYPASVITLTLNAQGVNFITMAHYIIVVVQHK